MSELSNSVLPDDIVVDILVRLSVKPIGRFRCVSKPWRSLLSCPKFIKSHTKFHSLKPTGYLTLKPHLSVSCILTLATAESTGTATNDGVASNLRSELERLERSEVVGLCDGLLLLKSSSWQDKWLVNPITLETAHILDDRDPNMYGHSCIYGLGYDSTNDDYKIVSMSENKDSTGSIVDVYSLRMKCWKRISVNSPYVLNTPGLTDRYPVGVFLNGRIHWFGFRTQGLDITGWSCTIVCFDLAREEFVEGLFPYSIQKEFIESDRVEEEYFHEIMVFNGYLAAVSYIDEKHTMNLWVMTEYGVRDSWTKFTTICPEVEEEDIFYDFVVSELNEDEIVLEKCNNEQRLVAYNWRNGISRDLIIAGFPVCDLGFSRVTPFKGSLLSPNLLR